MEKKLSEAEMYPLEVHHEAFVREGRMVAMPLGFPGATTAIPADESRVTALALRRDDRYETIYGGTSGTRAHLFYGWLRGVTGVIVDLGGDGKATETAGIVSLKDRVVAAVNGPEGGRLLARAHPPISYDCIQEWTMNLDPFQPVAEFVGERMLEIHAGAAGRSLVGCTTGGPFAWDPAAGRVVRVPGPVLRMARHPAGSLLGIDFRGEIGIVTEAGGGLRFRRAGQVPGSWQGAVWSGAGGPGLFLADDAGSLFEVARSGRARRVGKAPLAPVTCMASTLDGRLFGVCGREMGHLFVLEPGGKARDLGVALSVLNRRRYGYEFSCAVTDRDGHVLLGERDRAGHLWLLFPSIRRS
jgi:hypothetical protein